MGRRCCRVKSCRMYCVLHEIVHAFFVVVTYGHDCAELCKQKKSLRATSILDEVFADGYATHAFHATVRGRFGTLCETKVTAIYRSKRASQTRPPKLPSRAKLDAVDETWAVGEPYGGIEH